MNSFENKIHCVSNEKINSWDIVQKICKKSTLDDPLYICNIDDIIEKYNLWRKKIPRVKPYYAVKCNDSEIVLATLASLGIGFDCASKSEIERMLSYGVSSERIIFANPTKQKSHIKYANKVGVDVMTFDCATELEKIKEIYPGAR